jgi:hypothetical protein
VINQSTVPASVLIVQFVEVGKLMGVVHIENRRLFDMARGELKLEGWEEEHLHQCEVCQGVLYVLVSQVSQVPTASAGDIEKSPDAA